MNLLIIIRGPLGIGKTTVAKNLSKKLKTLYISIDEVLSQDKLDKIDEKIGCIPEKNFLKANDLLLSKINNFLGTVVVDGNFYYQNQIKDLIGKSQRKAYVLALLLLWKFA